MTGSSKGSGAGMDRAGLALVGISLVGLTAALTLQKIRAFDYWWHLRTGQWIAEHGSVPHVDPYTFTVPGARWVDIHWLFQLGLHAVYELGGTAGVVISKLVLTLLFVGVLARIGVRAERPALTGVALGLMLMLVSSRLMPRPELPSFVALAVILALLDRFERTGDARVYWIVAVQVFWVNVHGLFALGIALCAIQLAAEFLRPWVSAGERIDVARLRRIGAVTLLAAAASLLNPNFLDGALYPIQQLQMVGPPEDRGLFGSLIAELIPPLADERSLPPLSWALLSLLGGLSFGAMALNWRRLRSFDPLVWVAFLYLAFGAQRNIALFAIVATPILVRNANEWLDGRSRPPRLRRLAAVCASAAIALVAVDAARGSFFPRVGSVREPGLGVMEILYPVGAAEWIADHRPAGPICHHMADGGYLIWRLHPDYRVMSDGRLEVFGPEKFKQLQIGDLDSFARLDDEYGFGLVLVHYTLVDSEGLLRWLYLNSNWRLVYVDDVAALFARVRPGDPAALVDLDVDSDDLFEPLSGPPGTVDRLRRFARTNFYMALHRHERALQVWRGTLERYPDLPQGPVIHASLLLKNGLYAAAETILRDLNEHNDSDPRLATQIGDLRRASGDLDAAVANYERAIEIDPRFGYALFQLASIREQQRDYVDAVALYVRVVASEPGTSRLALAATRRVQQLRGQY